MNNKEKQVNASNENMPPTMKSSGRIRKNSLKSLFFTPAFWGKLMSQNFTPK